jgi:hypothetical protein
MNGTRKVVSTNIAKIQKQRQSKVLVYVTGDRKPENLFAAQVATDVLDLFYIHLKKLGKQNKISLLLHTSGGHLDAPWPIVNLIREFCNSFEVVVPIKALSAGTLLCLGADRIIMTSRSNLGPVDPRGIFSVEDKKLTVEIEDIMGYLRFVKEKVGIKDQSYLIEALKELTQKVPPPILGSIERTHSFIRNLSKCLLKLHLQDDKKIDDLVKNLSQDLFSHQHLISRKEAKETVGFGDIIEYADRILERQLGTLFDFYVNELELNIVFNPETILAENKYKPTDKPVRYTTTRAILESEHITHRFQSDYMITKDANNQIQVNQVFQGWR